VHGCLGVPGAPDKPLAFDTWRGPSRFFSKTLRLFRQALTQWGGWYETVSLHGAAPFCGRKAGALLAFSSPIKATDRGGDEVNVRPGKQGRESFVSHCPGNKLSQPTIQSGHWVEPSL